MPDGNVHICGNARVIFRRNRNRTSSCGNALNCSVFVYRCDFFITGCPLQGTAIGCTVGGQGNLNGCRAIFQYCQIGFIRRNRNNFCISCGSFFRCFRSGYIWCAAVIHLTGTADRRTCIIRLIMFLNCIDNETSCKPSNQNQCIHGNDNCQRFSALWKPTAFFLRRLVWDFFQCIHIRPRFF